MSKNLYPDIEPEWTLAPAARTTTATGDVVDLGTYPDATFLVCAGTVTDGTHTVEFQECATSDGTFTAIDDDDIEGDDEPALTTANDEDIFVTDYVGNKRYVKAKITVTGSPSTGGVIGVAVLKRGARHKPAQETQSP